MGEVKQTNFRIDQETADAFRKFCEDNGMNQAQGFDHIMQVVEMDRAKAATPTRITEIESFEKSVKDLMSAYLYSIEINQNAEGRIKEQFISDLSRKDKTIDDLRTKAEQLQTEKDAAEAAAAEAVMAAERASKDAAEAQARAALAENLVQEKEKAVQMLTDELTVTKEKAAGYDELKRTADTACAQVASLQESVKKAQEEADRALAEAIQRGKDALEAEKATGERTVAALQKDHMVELDSLKKAHAVEEDKLRSQMDRAVSDTKKDADLALARKDQEKAEAVADKEREMMVQLREADRENAHLQAQIEWLQKQIADLQAQVSDYQSREKIE